jgi:hypothetical protein
VRTKWDRILFTTKILEISLPEFTNPKPTWQQIA